MSDLPDMYSCSSQALGMQSGKLWVPCCSDVCIVKKNNMKKYIKGKENHFNIHKENNHILNKCYCVKDGNFDDSTCLRSIGIGPEQHNQKTPFNWLHESRSPQTSDSRL